MVIWGVPIQLHSLFHARHIYDFGDPRSLLEILEQQEPSHLPKLLRITIRYWREGSLDDFHDERSLILGLKRMFECAKLIQNAA